MVIDNVWGLSKNWVLSKSKICFGYFLLWILSPCIKISYVWFFEGHADYFFRNRLNPRRSNWESCHCGISKRQTQELSTYCDSQDFLPLMLAIEIKSVQNLVYKSKLTLLEFIDCILLNYATNNNSKMGCARTLVLVYADIKLTQKQ